MEEGLILISQLNDFVFCPASIYFHKLYEGQDPRLYQTTDQVNGKLSHLSVDEGRYSTKKSVLTGKDVFSEQYGLIGKIDIFHEEQGLLVERKRKIVKIYDGYVFQLYAQCLALREMGYVVKALRFHSLADNKTYPIALPEDDPERFRAFEETVAKMRFFEISSFIPESEEKCRHCIYSPACDICLV